MSIEVFPLPPPHYCKKIICRGVTTLFNGEEVNMEKLDCKLIFIILLSQKYSRLNYQKVVISGQQE